LARAHWQDTIRKHDGTTRAGNSIVKRFSGGFVKQWMSCLPRIVAGLSLAACLSVPAHAQRQVVSGEELAAWLQQADGSGLGRFTGFVLGVHDAFNEIMFCTSREVSASQIENAASGFVNAHPEVLYKSGADLVRLALSEAYPCRE
jgi:hypothetical protein